MARCKGLILLVVFVVDFLLSCVMLVSCEADHVSAVGDPGMKKDSLRLAIEAWNQCNEVGEEAPEMGSSRAADCFDVYKASPQKGQNNCSTCNEVPYILVHRATEKEYGFSVGEPFEGVREEALKNSDLYVVEKELYLGRKCPVEDTPNPWQFWMIMLESGNMDTYAAKCPKNGHKIGPYSPDSQFPCFGKGCMNQPLIYHNYTAVEWRPNRAFLKGRFYGSWDLDSH